jgi:hypothetical protein
MPRSKKIDDKKKSPDKKPTQKKENKSPKESPNKKVKPTQTKVKPPPTQTKENKKSPDKKVKPTQNKVKSPPTQTKENKKPNVVEEDIPKENRKIQKVVSLVDKEKSVSPQHQRKRSNSLELFDKYAYDIYTEDERRQEALGNLVIAFGPTELIKKLDSENMKSPNMSHKFNYDKKWVRDNFKSEKR